MTFDKQSRSLAKSIGAHGVGLLALVASIGLAACEGCRATGTGSTGGAGTTSTASTASSNGSTPAIDPGPPTLRLYLVSDLAGALEPCGCTKDQLGGLDHLAAWVHAEQAKAPASALVSAGPLFFMEPALKGDHAAQDIAKADTIAQSLKPLGFVAFAPGANDFCNGISGLAKLRDASGGSLVLANANVSGATGDAGAALGSQPLSMRDVGGVKVAFVGVSAIEAASVSSVAPSIVFTPPLDAVKTSVDAAKAKSAQIVVALAAIGRGEAKRLADAVPGLTAILVGSPGGSGDQNTIAPPPERLGNTIVAETGNHLTTVGVLDLFVRGGSFTFADATGLELGAKRDELLRRIDELRVKIAAWEKDAKITKSDLDARRAQLKKLEDDSRALDAPKPPSTGSFFRYTTKEIRDALGKDPQVSQAMLAYYKQVNDHNKVAFANRLPAAHTPDQATYVGIEACSSCHEEARAVWDKTAHAHAYATLSTQFKEFNLDCVSCHVTGYDLPGGSTVTHVDKLKDVQCEVCHGPGSKHAASPTKVAIAVKKPKGDSCLACHHPPHVTGFDPEKKLSDILGPGHGL